MSVKAGDAEKKRSASLLLSTTGAAVAGIGLGALFAQVLRPMAVTSVAVGILAHVIGMIGNRRAQVSTGYSPDRWEVIAYWLCWTLIAALAAYLSMRLGGLV